MQRVLRAVVLPVLSVAATVPLVVCAIPEAAAQSNSPPTPGTPPVDAYPLRPPPGPPAPEPPVTVPIQPRPGGTPNVYPDAGAPDAGARPRRPPVRRPRPGTRAEPFLPGLKTEGKAVPESSASRTDARRSARSPGGSSDPGCAGAGAIRRRGPA